MSKIWFLGLIILIVFLMPSLAWMETPVFTIAGKIIFHKKGNLRIAVVNEITFDDESRSPYKTEIPITPEDIKRGEKSFKFDNIPQGTYGIKCYQDVNGDGKLNMNSGVPTEPWGMYRNPRPLLLRGPTFKGIHFELNKDIIDIRIELK